MSVIPIINAHTNLARLPSMCTRAGYLRVVENRADTIETVMELMEWDEGMATALVDVWHRTRADVTEKLIAMAITTDFRIGGRMTTRGAVMYGLAPFDQIPGQPRTPTMSDIAPPFPSVGIDDLRRAVGRGDIFPEPGPTRREFAEGMESIRAAIRELECVVEPMADTLRDLRPHLLPPTIDALHKENGRLGSIIGEERARAKRAEDLFAATGIVVTRDDVAGVFVARLDSHAVMSQGTTEAEAVTACMNAAAMLHRHNVGALAKVREREVVGYIVKDVDGQYVRPDAKADDEPDGKWQYTGTSPRADVA